MQELSKCREAVRRLIKHSSTSEANCVSFNILDPPLFPCNLPVSIITTQFRVFGFLRENLPAVSCLKKKGEKGEIGPSRLLLIAYNYLGLGEWLSFLGGID